MRVSHFGMMLQQTLLECASESLTLWNDVAADTAGVCK